MRDLIRYIGVYAVSMAVILMSAKWGVSVFYSDIPGGRLLSIPVFIVPWFALAIAAQWISERTGWQLAPRRPR